MIVLYILIFTFLDSRKKIISKCFRIESSHV
jgi:hypothetical protein